MLYGRDAERSLLGGLLDGARASRSAVLVIRGEPGAGKSALLDDARQAADGMTVLAARGIESEAQLPFAALHQLTRPALEHLGQLPDPQAGALRRALGLEEGEGDDRFLVSLAVLSLLAEAAEQRPLLCLIDDAHWLDDASADALVFVARRLEAEGVVILFGAREGEARRFDAPGLPELNLGGLDREAADALLDCRAGLPLSPEVRDRLIEGTGGNPLALLELPGTLGEARLSGTELIDGPLPVSARVERAFLARARRLPQDTQTLLLVAAADDAGELATVLRAARSLGIDAAALDGAEQEGLVRIQGTRIEFRHPLVGSAVYQGAPLSRRQEVHRALADALESDTDQRAWHRASATVEPDALVAGALERAAGRARHRSGYAAASLALERAAALTDDDATRARRLSAAAGDAWLAGRLERAVMLLDRVRPLATDPVLLSDMGRLQGLVELTSGVPADAFEIFARAAGLVASRDGGRALYLLGIASVAAGYAADTRGWVAISDMARDVEVEDTADSRFLRRLLSGLGALSADDFEGAVPELRAALAGAEELDADRFDTRPGLLVLAGATAFFLGDDEAAHRFNHRAATRARARGAVGILTQILPRLAHTELWAGRWQPASANAREGLQLAREVGQHDVAAHTLVVLALAAAPRGDEEECRSLVAESRDLALARGLVHVADLGRWALAMLDLAAGGAEEALAHLREMSAPAAVLWAALDRIEAAVRAGEPDTAHGWLQPFERWATSTGAPWALGVASHGRALMADAEEAERLFEAALRAHRRAARPLERARAELAFGEFLRRGRRRVEARDHLRAALDGFETLGARPWAERARAELRASGQTARRRDPSTTGRLTAQELQIARFVGQGLTNRDVAAQLFLSRRTIDFHLRNVFRKLGIATRTELARLDLDSVAESAPGAGDPATSPART